MADNVSIVINPFGTDLDLVNVGHLNTSTTNASGITATWSLSRTSEHTHIVDSTALPLLEPVVCGGVTYSSTNGQAILYDLDEAVSNGSSPPWETQTLSFGTNSVGNVSMGVMTTFNADAGTEADLYIIYGPFGVVQYHNFDGVHALNSHGQVGAVSQVGPFFNVEPNVPCWITLRKNDDDETNEVVVQDGTTGAFIGCSRCASGSPIDLVSFVIGDYLVPAGGSFKHSIIALAFDAKATVPLLPGSFVLPPPPFVVATDNTSDISLDFGHLTANSSAFGYKIERTSDNGVTWTVVEANLPAPLDDSSYVSPYTDVSVSNDVTYRYKITSLIHAWGSVPTYSNYIKHGAAVWYDSVDPVITDTTNGNDASSYVHSVRISLPQGTASKVRVYIKDGFADSDVAFKIALYTDAGALLANATGIIPMALADSWVEMTVAPTDVTAGFYKVAWAALANGTTVTYRYKNGAGQTDVSASGTFVSFPDDPLAAPAFNLTGADAAGVHVAPLIDLSLATVLNGAPIF